MLDLPNRRIMKLTHVLIIFILISIRALTANADLVKAAYEGATDDEVQKLLLERKSSCLNSARAECFSLEDISGAICDTANNKLNFSAKKSIWLSVLNEKTTSSQLSKALYTLRKCQSSEEYKKTIALVFLVNAFESKNKKLSDFLLKWLGSLDKAATSAEALLYRVHLSAFKFFINNKPYLLSETSVLSKGLLKHFDESSFWKSSKKYSSEDSNLLSQWLYSVSSRLILDGDLDLFSKIIEKHSYLLDTISVENRYLVLQNLCLHWYNNQLSQKCSTFSKPWLSVSSSEAGVEEFRDLFEIRLASLRGDFALAEKKIKEFTSKYKVMLEKDPSKTAWLQLDLSSVYAYGDKVEEAKNALTTFEVYCNGLSQSFCMLYAVNNKTLIDTTEKNCSKVNQDAQSINSVFATQISGVPYDLIVSSYYNLYCTASLGDKASFEKFYKIFDQMIQPKTSLSNFKKYASLLRNHVLNQNLEAQLKAQSMGLGSDVEIRRLRKLLDKKP